MAITFRASTTRSQGSSSTLTITRPTTVSGDVVLVQVVNDMDRTITPPTGFTSLSRTSLAGVAVETFIKVVGGSEPASYDFVLSSGATVQAIAASYSGVSPSAPVEDSNPNQGSSSSVTGDSVTSAGAGRALLWMAQFAGGPTLSGPSGMTQRVSYSPNYVQVLKDQTVGSGETGTRVGSLSFSREWQCHMVLLAPANAAPNAPTSLSPDGVTIDKDATQRFSWVFSDPDSGDSQSKYDLRYRPNDGVSAWTTVTTSTPNTFHDFTAGTFTAGDWEWQVRTYDAVGVVGPYSASAFFTAAVAPNPPTITDPINNGTVSSDPYTVTWSTPDQDAYQVRTVADDGAGNPATATVYTDTGTVESTSARSRSAAFPTNGQVEHVQVRIRNDGLWSDWTSVKVTVSYTAPATPTVTVTADSPTGAITAEATHPAPTGSEPTVVSVDWWRRRVVFDAAGNPIGYDENQGGEDGNELARGWGLTPAAQFTDWQIASGATYEYRARAWGDNGVSTYSAWTA